MSTLPPDYKPEDDKVFMSPLQQEYFRQKLLRWRSDLLVDSDETRHHLKEDSLVEADLTDRASTETERSLAFRLRLQAWDRTLTDKQVDRVVGKVIKRLVEDLGVEQRL